MSNHTEVGYDWRPGRVEVVIPPIRTGPRWAMVYDDGGHLVARFTVGGGCLKVSHDAADKAHTKVSWRDATLIWARYPAWVRGAVAQQLGLYRGPHVTGSR